MLWLPALLAAALFLCCLQQWLHSLSALLPLLHLYQTVDIALL
jgi:hypothetical protein